MSRLAAFAAGVRVLDLSRHLPGPLATLLLADMGAVVTKLEPPAGDEMRFIGPAAFQALNAGKTTRRLDLKSAEGRADLPRSRAGRRRPARIVPPRHHGAPRPRLRNPARAQPRPHLLRPQRLRPHRALRRPRRPRPYLPGRNRRARRDRPPLDPLPAARRHQRRAVRHHRHPRRAQRPSPRRAAAASSTSPLPTRRCRHSC